MNTYGLKISVALLLTFVPVIQAYLYFGTIDTYPYIIGLAVGAAATALVAVLIRRSSRGRSRSTDSLETIQARLCLGYLAPPLWVLSAALVGNRLFDKSPASQHATHLLNFVIQRRGPSTVQVESWRKPGESEFLRYDWRTMWDISSSTPRGQLLIVSIRKGALGWNWVERIRQGASR